jgi:signal transduction histidine kinase
LKKYTKTTSEENQIKRLKKDIVYMQDIIDTIREAFVILRKDLRVVAANPAFYQLFDVEKKDTEGKFLYELGNRQWDIPELRELLEKIIPTHSVFTDYPVNHIFPKIGRKIMLINARRIDDKSLILLAFQDDTQRREKEAILRQEHNQNFIAIASHELKTPVTSIKAYTQVLQSRFDEINDTVSVDLLSKMNGQIDKLTMLIKDLLDVTKIEEGKLQLHEDVFDFDILIAEVVEDVQTTISKHKLILQGRTQKRISGDKERIGQVLINLLTNAVKYSPQSDRVIITLSSNTTSVTVAVIDFGIGIPNDRQEKVFDRFYRESGSQETTYPGLGLGLFIAKEIIERQGGKIGVSSTQGKGSTFSFRLPLKARK